MKPRILVVGSLVMDLICSTPRFPQSGETVTGTAFRTAPFNEIFVNMAALLSSMTAKVVTVLKKERII